MVKLPLIYVFLLIIESTLGFLGGCGIPPPVLPSLPPPPQPLFQSPCQPRPFLPPPPPPPPQPLIPPPQPFGQPCSPCQQQFYPQQQYVQYQQYYKPQHHLPPLIPSPKLYPEITPEEYMKNNKIIKETIIKKKIPNPFDDLERPLPVILPNKRPMTGCEGYLPYYQYRQQSMQQHYPQYLPPRTPYPTAPPPQPINPPPIFSSCCTRCGCNVRALGQKVSNSTEKTEGKHDSGNEIKENDEELSCNNKELKEIMLKNKEVPLKEAKILIHEEAEKKLGENFQVICAEFDFEYVTKAIISCQIEMTNGICYAFKTG